MRYLKFTIAIATGAFMSITSACSSTPTESAAGDQSPLVGFHSQQLTWGACPSSPAATPSPSGRNLQCATLNVPLDYDNPSGKTISLTISRLAATDQEHKKGAMIVFPGGPGVSGLQYPLTVDALDGGKMGRAYDLIGFDHRGIGASTPLKCGLSREQSLYNYFPVPSPRGMDEDIAMAGSIGETCQKNAGDYLKYVNTSSLARDLEIIREVLKVPDFAYIGGDYAASLLVNYMSQFPGHVSKAVFDSVPDVTVSVQQADLNTAPAMADRFYAIATKLSQEDQTYHLGSTKQAVQQVYVEKVAELDVKPQQLADLTVNGDLLRTIRWVAMFNGQATPQFGTVLSALVHRQNEASAADILRRVDVTPTLLSDSFTTGQFVIGCTHSEWDRNIENYKQRLAEYTHLYPVDGPPATNINACAFWPIPAPSSMPKIDPETAPSTLMLHSKTDPVFSYKGALVARRAFGDRARLVSVEMEGTRVLSAGLRCPIRAVDEFLMDDTLPAEGTTCSE